MVIYGEKISTHAFSEGHNVGIADANDLAGFFLLHIGTFVNTLTNIRFTSSRGNFLTS
jgi:hypothetical protein